MRASCSSMPPESIERVRGLPETEDRVGIERQPLLVQAKCFVVVAGHVVRHPGDATHEWRERIVGDGLRRPARPLRPLAEQAAEIAHVDVGERVVRIATQRLIQIGACARPVGTQVELELPAQHVQDRREIRLQLRRAASIASSACGARASIVGIVLIDAEPDVRLREPDVRARIRSGRGRAPA